MDSITASTTIGSTEPAPPPSADITVTSASNTAGPIDQTITYGYGTNWVSGTITAPPPKPTPALIAEVFEPDPSMPSPIEEGIKTSPIRLVAVGWSKNGRYYSRELLQNRAALWKAGTQMFLEHNDRHIRDLAAALVRDSYYDEHGRWGPGIYGDAEVFEDHRAMLKARKNAAGTSITAMGVWKPGEAEGRKGDIVTDLTEGLTVDFVAQPAAGGMYDISESISATMTPDPLSEAQAEIVTLRTELAEKTVALATSETALSALRQTVARLSADKILAEKLGASKLPELARTRVTKTILASLPMTEAGDLDEAALATAIEAEVTDMTTFLEGVAPKKDETPAGSPVEGMGAAAPAGAASKAAWTEAFLRQGKTPEEAERLAEYATEG